MGIQQLKTRAIVAALAVACPIAACSRPAPPAPSAPPAYWFNIVHTGWLVEAYVNGQPAVQGGRWSSLWDFTGFVIDGDNEIRIVAVRDSQAQPPAKRFEINVGRTLNFGQGDYEQLGGIQDDDAADRDRFETVIRFTARMPMRWVWQDADELDDLTDADRAEITALVHAIADRWRARDAQAVYRLGAEWAPAAELRAHFGERVGLDHALLESAVRERMAERDYGVVVAPPESWRWMRGSKVVRIYVPLPADFDDLSEGNYEPLIRGGPRAFARSPDVGTAPYIDCCDLLFMRQNGMWIVMNPHWKP